MMLAVAPLPQPCAAPGMRSCWDSAVGCTGWQGRWPLAEGDSHTHLHRRGREAQNEGRAPASSLRRAVLGCDWPLSQMGPAGSGTLRAKETLGSWAGHAAGGGLRLLHAGAEHWQARWWVVNPQLPRVATVLHPLLQGSVLGWGPTARKVRLSGPAVAGLGLGPMGSPAGYRVPWGRAQCPQAQGWNPAPLRASQAESSTHKTAVFPRVSVKLKSKLAGQSLSGASGHHLPV